MDQGTDEWRAIRCGKITASRIADLTAKTKTGPSASRGNYIAELVAERLTGIPVEHYTNAAMQWGTDNESAARDAYSFYRDADVQEVGFVHHPELEMTGASPDGLVGDDGLVEIKCPNTATHIETLLSGNAVPGKYAKQMQWQMACTGRVWCDFVSFDPRMPEAMRLHVVRVYRDDKTIAELTGEVATALADIAKMVADLRTKFEAAA